MMVLPGSESVALRGAVHIEMPQFTQEKDLPTARQRERRSQPGPLMWAASTWTIERWESTPSSTTELIQLGIPLSKDTKNENIW